MAQILIIDGSAEIRGILSQALVHFGHRVVVAEDGWKAVVGFRSHGADLVILDLLAPEVEVLQTIAELRSMSDRVKILAMSRWSGLEERGRSESARALGIDGTISKPFSLIDLVVAVDGMLPHSTTGLFRACS
jgi:two-component system response regulator RegX3